MLSAFWRALIAGEIFPLNFIAWIGLVAFWAFPLGAGLWEPRAGTRPAAEWPFLGSVPGPVPLMELPLRLRRALLIGVVGGLAAGFVLPWLRLPLPVGALHDVGYPETADAAMILSMTLTSMVVQGVIAALVVLVIPKLPIPHAMFAAFVGGWILTGGEVLQLVLRGTSLGTGLDRVLVPVVFGGALLALVAALVMSALRLPTDALVTRLRRGRELAITEQQVV